MCADCMPHAVADQGIVAPNLGVRQLGQRALSGLAPGTATLLPVGLAAASLGMARSALEVAWRINLSPVWYSWNPDIVLSVVWGVVHLVFFGAMVLDVIGRLLHVHIPPRQLLGICGVLQVLQVLIPELDAIGQNAFGWPAPFRYVQPPIHAPLYTTDLVMTTGIIIGWMAALTVLARFYTHQGVRLTRTLLLLFLSYQFIFWPVYHLWPAMNYLYYHVLLRQAYSWPLHYAGYAWYFVLASLAGVVYFRRRYQVPWW